MSNFYHAAQVAASIVGGWIGWYLGDANGLLIALLCLITLDYISGVMVAIKNRRLSSAVGFVGICRKLLMLALVGVCNIIDTQVIGSGAAFRTLGIIYYMSNEGISIVENAAALGLPVPKKLTDFFQQLKSKSEEDE